VHGIGDAPVCDPKPLYGCLKPTMMEYARNNELTKCNCPRRCHRLTYDYTVSQAEFSDFQTELLRNKTSLNRSSRDIKYDICTLRVTMTVFLILSSQLKTNKSKPESAQRVQTAAIFVESHSLCQMTSDASNTRVTV